MCDLWRKTHLRQLILKFAKANSAYTFDNIASCSKDKKPLLRKELAASIEVKS